MQQIKSGALNEIGDQLAYTVVEGNPSPRTAYARMLEINILHIQ